MCLEYLKKLTRDHFREWVESIDVSKIKPVLDLPDTASFVTFNYTPTLEYVYGVRSANILHIHGCVLDKNELLQFGSPDNNPFELEKMLEDKYGMDDFYGATIQQGVTVACDRCADTWKNIKGNYDALNHFLDTLAKCQYSNYHGQFVRQSRYAVLPRRSGSTLPRCRMGLLRVQAQRG